jgi:hypothetical protein
MYADADLSFSTMDPILTRLWTEANIQLLLLLLLLLSTCQFHLQRYPVEI